MQIILIIAMLPAFILMYLIYRMDKVEKEPAGLIIKLFFLGMLSTVIASILETIGQLILNSFMRDQWSMAYNLIMYFIIVGISEEGAKYAMTRAGSWKSPNFDYHFDGIVYATAVALGFAAAENVLYIMNFGLGVAPIRAVTAIPMHCIAGIFMGHYYGMAKQYSLQGLYGKEKAYNLASVLVPAVLHGFYDFCASSQDSFLSVCFLIYVIVLFTFALISIRRYARQDTPLEGAEGAGNGGTYGGTYGTYGNTGGTYGAGSYQYGGSTEGGRYNYGSAENRQYDYNGSAHQAQYGTGRTYDYSGTGRNFSHNSADGSRSGYSSVRYARTKKYVRTISELRGHDAFEFARGSSPIGHWLSDSFYLPEDTFQEKGLDQLFMEGLPGFAYFGDTITSQEEWNRLMETARNRFPETMDIMNELNAWAQDMFVQSGYITIHGV